MTARRTIWLWLPVAVLLDTLLCPAPARAHLNSTGMGPIYDGLMHFLMSPEDLVPALALALLAGMRGASHGRRALFVLPSAWLLGGLLGLTAAVTHESAVISALWFLVLGGLLAVDARLPEPGTVALALGLGTYHGYVNGSGMAAAASVLVALLGLVSGVFMLVAVVSAFVVRLRAGWARIAVRVAGSWIAASGLLLLGWATRRG